MGNLGTAPIGGVTSGIVVVILGALVAWCWDRFARFELRFLDPEEPIDAEGMKKSIAIGIPAGDSVVRFGFRPRIGIRLELANFAFFNNRRFPWRLGPTAVGRRRDPSEVSVSSLKFRRDDGEWDNIPVESRHDQAMVASVGQGLKENKRTVFELGLRASQSMGNWDGIMSFQLHYEHVGTLGAIRNVHAKVFVRQPTKRRPISFALRSVQRARRVNGE